MNPKKDYLITLKFGMDDDFFTDPSSMLFPGIVYYISDKSDGKLGKIEWHKSMNL